MPREIAVICDWCGRDLTYRTKAVEYRLSLVNQAMPLPPDGGNVSDVVDPPIITHDAYFCSLDHLSKWLAPQVTP